MPNFSPPHDPSGRYEPEYMTNLYGASWSSAWNTSIYGSPTVAGANVLCNCVGYAQGRMIAIYREITGYNPAQTRTHPFVALNANAGEWAGIARSIGLTVVNEPQEGSVFVTPNHVGVVEKYDNGSWWISESGYDAAAYLYQQSIYKSGNTWYSTYSSYPNNIIGFILIPGAAPGPTPPGPTPGERKKKWIYYLKNWNNEIF